MAEGNKLLPVPCHANCGTDSNNILQKMSPLNPMYLTKKHKVFQLIVVFAGKFKGIGENCKYELK